MHEPAASRQIASAWSAWLALTHAPSPKMAQCQLTHLARVPIDLDLASRQHAEYCRALAECGATVRTLKANLEFPDCAFIEDTAIVLDEVAVVTSMGAPSRRKEPEGVLPELRKHREVRRVELSATIEGGDVLRIGRKLLVGHTARTNRAGIEALAAAARPYGHEVTVVTPRDCLHLKSACTALPDGSLLTNPAWLEAGALRGFSIIPVAETEPWAANVAVVGENVIAGAQYPLTVANLRQRGFQVRTVELSEFAKAEGAVTCLSLLFEPRRT